MLRQFIYDDLKLEYLEINNQKSKNLIFLHGFSSDFNFFNSWYPELSKNFNIYALNMPAHGKSEAKLDIMTEIDLMKIFIAWIKELQLNNLYLVGHSMGGALALMSVQELNDKIEKIILIGPQNRSSLVREQDFYDTFFPRKIEDYAKLVKLCYYYPDKILNNKEWMKRVEKYLNENQEQLDLVYTLGRDLPKTANMDLIDFGIKNLKNDLILIYGEADGIIDAKNIDKYFLSLNPKTKVYKVNQAGHTVWLENPVEFAKIMQKEKMI